MTISFEIEDVKQLIKDALEKALEFFKKGSLNEAETIYRQILRVHPEEYMAIHMLALIAHKTGNNEEASELMQKALELEPEKWEIYNNLAAVHGAMGQYDKAIEYLNILQDKDPNNIHAHNNLGLFYQTTKQFDKAEKHLQKAVELKPKEPYLYFNLGNVYADQLKNEEAIKEFRKCLELKPDFTPAKWNLASALLLTGEWEEGWKAYESRWDQFEPFKKGKKKYPPEREWDGEENIREKTLVLYSEQGVGDTFQFIRYAKEIKKMGAKVLLECPNPKHFSDIVSLMQNQDYIDDVYLSTDKIPEYDYNQAITSLPRIFNTTVDDVPWDKPYISPKKTEISDDEKWLKYKNKFKIGICWGGNVVHRRDCDRSCYLHQFKPIEKINNVKLFSLQKDIRKRVWPGKGEVDLTKDSKGMSVVDMIPFLNNFNDTANVINEMDLIITVDTAVAHLAAAMGKKVWVLLSYVPDWRWLLTEKNKTPWYPTMTLYRQPKWNDWESVFEKVSKDVQSLVG